MSAPLCISCRQPLDGFHDVAACAQQEQAFQPYDALMPMLPAGTRFFGRWARGKDAR